MLPSLAMSVLPSWLGVMMWLHGHFSGKAILREVSPSPTAPAAPKSMRGCVWMEGWVWPGLLNLSQPLWHHS